MALPTICVLLAQAWIASCFRLDNVDEANSYQALALRKREIASAGVYASSGSQGNPEPEREVHAHVGGIISVFNDVPAGLNSSKIKMALTAALPPKGRLWFISEVDDKQRCFCAMAPFDGDVEFFERLTLVVGGAKLEPELCQGDSLAVGLTLLPKHILERREKEFRASQAKLKEAIVNGTQHVKSFGTLRNRAKEVINLGIDDGTSMAVAKGSAETHVVKNPVAQKVVVETVAKNKSAISTATAQKPAKGMAAAGKAAAEMTAGENVAARRVTATTAAAEKVAGEKVVAKKAVDKMVVAAEAAAEAAGVKLAEGKATAKQAVVKKGAEKPAAQNPVEEKNVAEKIEKPAKGTAAAGKAAVEMAAEEKVAARRVAVKKAAAEKVEEEKVGARKASAKRGVAERAVAEEAGEKLPEGKATVKEAAVKKGAEEPAAQNPSEEKAAAGSATSETVAQQKVADCKAAAERAATGKKAMEEKAPRVNPTNVLERVHAVLYDQVELASQAVEQLKTSLAPGEVTRRVVRYIYNSAKREDVSSMRFEEACDDLVKIAMGSYEAAYGEKEWFPKLDLAPAFAAAAWELFRGRQGLRFEQVEAKTRAAFHECLDSYMLDKNLWEASINTFKDAAIHKKVYEALQKTHRPAFDATIMAVRPEQESERVQNFLKLWIHESMTKAWNSIDDPQSVLTERNVSRLFQNVMLNNRVWGASSGTSKDAAIHNKVYAEVQKAYRPAFDATLREVIPGQELERVQDFLKHWIGESMSKTWKSASDAERVLTLSNVSRVFQNMFAPFGHYDLYSTITKREARAKKPAAVVATKGVVKTVDSKKAAANEDVKKAIEKTAAVGGAAAEKASEEETAISAIAEENLAENKGAAEESVKEHDAGQEVAAKKTAAEKAAGKKTVARNVARKRTFARKSAGTVAKEAPSLVAPA